MFGGQEQFGLTISLYGGAIVAIIGEALLLVINYVGRKVLGFREQNPIWRKFDKAGLFWASIFLHAFFTVLLILGSLHFEVPILVDGYAGAICLNVGLDGMSLKRFMNAPNFYRCPWCGGIMPVSCPKCPYCDHRYQWRDIITSSHQNHLSKEKEQQ